MCHLLVILIVLVGFGVVVAVWLLDGEGPQC